MTVGLLACGALGFAPLGHGLGARAAWAQNVYVLNSGSGSVTVYPAGAGGDVAPLRTISGPATGLSFPRGLAVDSQHDLIMVGDSDRIFVYPRSASGDAPPTRTIHLPDTGLVNLSVNMVNGEMVGADEFDSILVYGPTASGSDPPLRKIQGAATGLGIPAGHPVGVAVDPTSGEIVVTRAGGQSDAVLVYGPTASGNTAPIRSISGPATGLGLPEAVVVDTVNDEILVLNATFSPLPTITVYPRTASGNVAPRRTIGGSASGMSAPLSLALDPVTDEILVANRNSNTITVYPRTARGNVAPTRTIGGATTALAVPDSIALDQPAGPPPPPTTLVASVLPNVRAVQAGTLVTVNATVINAGSNPALQVSIALATVVDTTFNYQEQDTSGALVGSPGTPVDIPPGGRADFVLFLTPGSPFGPTELVFTFAGANTPPVATLVGINTLGLLSSAGPTADMVALAATSPNDGIVRIPGTSGTGVFAVATDNLGIGDTITVTADTGAAAVPVSTTICETNPGTGACLAPPGAMVSTFVAAGTTPTFGFFVSGMGVPIPLDPAVNRVFARFRRSDGLVVGGTSVAVETQ